MEELPAWSCQLRRQLPQQLDPELMVEEQLVVLLLKGLDQLSDLVVKTGLQAGLEMG